MKTLFVSTALLASLLLCTAIAQASKYTVYVYCANGKIELDTRNPQQMQSAKGKGTYAMSEFSYRIDAEKFAKQLGGIGAKCPKK